MPIRSSASARTPAIAAAGGCMPALPSSAAAGNDDLQRSLECGRSNRYQSRHRTTRNAEPVRSPACAAEAKGNAHGLGLSDRRRCARRRSSLPALARPCPHRGARSHSRRCALPLSTIDSNRCFLIARLPAMRKTWDDEGPIATGDVSPSCQQGPSRQGGRYEVSFRKPA